MRDVKQSARHSEVISALKYFKEKGVNHSSVSNPGHLNAAAPESEIAACHFIRGGERVARTLYCRGGRERRRYFARAYPHGYSVQFRYPFKAKVHHCV